MNTDEIREYAQKHQGEPRCRCPDPLHSKGDAVQLVLQMCDEIDRLRDKIEETIQSCQEKRLELRSDDRYPDNRGHVNVQINAPVALMQCEMTGEVRGLSHALKMLEATDD